MERLSVEGYEKSVTLITKTVITTLDYQLISTSSQWLHGVIRYSIKVLSNNVLYRCIADYEFETQKVNVIEFTPEMEMKRIKEKTISESEFHSSESSKVAFQYVNSKYGLKVFGMMLSRLSTTHYKYASEFRFIYIGEEKAIIINVVVTNKLYPYIVWMEERTEVSEIVAIVEKSQNVEKLLKEESFLKIKMYIEEVSHLEEDQI